MTYNRYMADLYGRLTGVGFDAAFVRDCVLPDWWEDAMAKDDSSRAMAEIAISRHLGFPLKDLSNRERELKSRVNLGARLKRATTAGNNEVAAAVRVAYRAGKILHDAVKDIPAFSPLSSAADIRKAILADNEYVNLDSLLRYAWSHGIPVARLRRVPKLTKKIMGMAARFQTRPVIILASGHDVPARLAFHLGHEIGHVAAGHLEVEDAAVDIDLERGGAKGEEKAADEFATELLTSDPDTRLTPTTYGLTGLQLAHSVIPFSKRYRIDPGVAVLNYAWSQNRFGVAGIALKALSIDSGGRDQIDDCLKSNLGQRGCSEGNSRFLHNVLSG